MNKKRKKEGKKKKKRWKKRAKKETLSLDVQTKKVPQMSTRGRMEAVEEEEEGEEEKR